MNLYLLRHGEAADRGSVSRDRDDERPLSDEGRRRVGRVARGLRAIGVDVDVILSSPLLRALQTAQAVAAAFRPGPRVESTPHLAPGGSATKLLELIASRHGRHDGVLLVGHEPDLGAFAASLMFGEAIPCLRLKKGGLVRLSASPPFTSRCAELLWLLTPRQLMVLGKA